MSTTRIYGIRASAVAEERRKSGGDPSKVDFSRVLTLDTLTLPRVGPHDVRLRILAVSGEHNVEHAAVADIVDIAKTRGGKIYPGNSAIAEVVEVGEAVRRFAIGNVVQTHCNGTTDEYGYPLRIWGFDQPDSIGWYAQEAVVREWQLLPLPLDCGLSLWEMAALPLRAPTAHHLWRRAIGIYRLKVPSERRAVLNVLSFGGGVGELFLMLARAHGHNAYFCSGNADRRLALEKQGIMGIDQLAFNRFASDEDVAAFARHCKALTGNTGFHVVCDMLRGRIFAAGLSVAAREGVNVSAGWKLAKTVIYDSALGAVKQLTLDHAHYETVFGCAATTELYGRVFRPTIHKEIYPFEDLPRCFKEMQQNSQTGIPIIRVAVALPDSVKHLDWRTGAPGQESVPH